MKGAKPVWILMQLILVFNFFYAPVMDGHLLAQKSKGPLLKLNQIKVDTFKDTGDLPVRCYLVFLLVNEGRKGGSQATRFSFLKQRKFVTGREEGV